MEKHTRMQPDFVSTNSKKDRSSEYFKTGTNPSIEALYREFGKETLKNRLLEEKSLSDEMRLQKLLMEKARNDLILK